MKKELYECAEASALLDMRMDKLRQDALQNNMERETQNLSE